MQKPIYKNQCSFTLLDSLSQRCVLWVLSFEMESSTKSWSYAVRGVA